MCLLLKTIAGYKLICKVKLWTKYYKIYYSTDFGGRRVHVFLRYLYFYSWIEGMKNKNVIALILTYILYASN